jgi:hypothetical protein
MNPTRYIVGGIPTRSQCANLCIALNLMFASHRSGPYTRIQNTLRLRVERIQNICVLWKVSRHTHHASPSPLRRRTARLQIRMRSCAI